MRHVMMAMLLVACGTDDPGAPADCVVRKTSVEPVHQHEDGGGSYAGVGCIESQCHLGGALGPQAPAYLAAGTIFKLDGITPQGGVTVRLTPLTGGTAATSITDDGGNFVIAANVPNPFPAIPEVTACPKVERMLEGAFDASYGNCHASGCHSGARPITLRE